MNTISTQNLVLLLPPQQLKEICKSIAAIEAVICPEWQYRYYSYQNNWSEFEEVFEMRDGQGDQMLILFAPEGVIINGFAHESVMSGWKSIDEPIKLNFFQRLFSKERSKTSSGQRIWDKVVSDVPKVFNEFIYGEPVKSIGTTFCVWQTESDTEWQIGAIDFPNDDFKDGSGDLLMLLDGNPLSYQKWASSYYDNIYIEHPEFVLKLEFIEAIYNKEPITKELALSINPLMDDFDKLKLDLDEIGYPHKL